MQAPFTLNLAQIQPLITVSESIAVVEAAFAALDARRAILPSVINLDIPAYHGEIHVKSAYLNGDDYYTIKIASGFYDNPARGLPVGNGLMLVYDAHTGQLAAQLIDEGWLTELRTGAAGAVCARYLACSGPARIGVVGAGSQARFQVDAIRHVRSVASISVWSRSHERALAYAGEMRAKMDAPITIADNVEQVIRDSDLILTVTPSHVPLVKAEWVQKGQTLIAVGSDGSDKQELEAGVLACADRVVADVLTQCVRLGEIHHAVAAGVLDVGRVIELGAIVNRRAVGRASDDEIIVCDLTGVGVQDTAVASLVARKAL